MNGLLRRRRRTGCEEAVAVDVPAPMTQVAVQVQTDAALVVALAPKKPVAVQESVGRESIPVDE